jgi:hypothetical protein
MVGRGNTRFGPSRFKTIVMRFRTVPVRESIMEAREIIKQINEQDLKTLKLKLTLVPLDKEHMHKMYEALFIHNNLDLRKLPACG